MTGDGGERGTMRRPPRRPASRSERESQRSVGLLSNWRLLVAVVLTVVLQLALVYLPFLHGWVGTAALGAGELTVVAVASTTAFVAVEREKPLRRNPRARKDGAS